MKKAFSLILITLAVGFTATAKPQTPVRTVDYVDPVRYMGKWHQIAAIPQYFERNCYSQSAAEYSLTPKGKVVVYNTCRTKDGELESATGRAKIVDKQTNAKLKVTFLNLGIWVYWIGGHYWVLDLDPDYRWAIVGEGTRTYAWILARDPALSPADLKLISAKLKSQGYDTCQLITARQDGGFQERKPLCEVVENN